MDTEAATAMMLGAHEETTVRCAAAIGGRPVPTFPLHSPLEESILAGRGGLLSGWACYADF
jgi:hypothetical protein